MKSENIMKKHTQKNRQIIMLSAAAFFIAAAFLCMRFYNMSSYKTPENPFSALSESLAEEDGQGGEGYETSSQPKDESSDMDSSQQMTVITLIVATAIQIQQKALRRLTKATEIPRQ